LVPGCGQDVVGFLVKIGVARCGFLPMDDVWCWQLFQMHSNQEVPNWFHIFMRLS